MRTLYFILPPRETVDRRKRRSNVNARSIDEVTTVILVPRRTTYLYNKERKEKSMEIVHRVSLGRHSLPRRISISFIPLNFFLETARPSRTESTLWILTRRRSTAIRDPSIHLLLQRPHSSIFSSTRTRTIAPINVTSFFYTLRFFLQMIYFDREYFLLPTISLLAFSELLYICRA